MSAGAFDFQDLDNYQSEALRTWRMEDRAPDFRSLYLCTGLAGEVGEAIDYVKKHAAHGHDIDDARLLKEFGDVLWYLAVLSAEYGFSLAEIASENVAKLRKRYPNGYSDADSRNRVDEWRAETFATIRRQMEEITLTDENEVPF